MITNGEVNLELGLTAISGGAGSRVGFATLWKMTRFYNDQSTAQV